MDENCLRQFKVAGMKFWLGATQVIKRRFQPCAPPLAVSGDKRGSVILGGHDDFAVEGGRGHLAGGVCARDGALGDQVKG